MQPSAFSYLSDATNVPGGVKNAPLSPSGGLGLGDELAQKVQDEIINRRKQAMAVPNQPPSAYGMLGLGIGSQPQLGTSAWSLLGQGGTMNGAG